jgi:transposase, IS5 family
MKAHIGTNRDSGIVHTVISTAGNISNTSQTDKLLHGQETQVHPDAGYTGVEKREETAVGHPFHVLKNLFRHRKTRYRGLAKNHHQLQVHFGLGNLVVAARKLAYNEGEEGRGGQKSPPKPRNRH